jgi:hypothetical protein
MTDKVIMICGDHKECFMDVCPHREEHPATDHCKEPCGSNGSVCFMAEFEMVPDSDGDEEEIR